MAKVRLLNGKPLMVGGKVATSDDCCCPSACPDCPAVSVTITFSGVIACVGCVPVVTNLASYIIGGSIDGTYTLPVHAVGGGACCYEGLFTGPSVDDYIGIDCSVFDTTETWTLFIRVGRSSPACEWAVYAWIEGAGGDQLVSFIGAPQSSFSAPFSNTTVCGSGGGTVSNPCENEAWNAVGHENGTAILTL